MDASTTTTISTEKPWMTIERAEEIYMAHTVGMFYGSQSELAHAVLLLSAQDKEDCT